MSLWALWALEWHWESLTVFSMVFSHLTRCFQHFMMFLASLSLAFFSFIRFLRTFLICFAHSSLFSQLLFLCVFFALPPDCFHCCACCADCVSQHVVALCSTWWSHQMSAYVSICQQSENCEKCQDMSTKCLLSVYPTPRFRPRMPPRRRRDEEDDWKRLEFTTMNRLEQTK